MESAITTPLITRKPAFFLEMGASLLVIFRNKGLQYGAVTHPSGVGILHVVCHHDNKKQRPCRRLRHFTTGSSTLSGHCLTPHLGLNLDRGRVTSRQAASVDNGSILHGRGTLISSSRGKRVDIPFLNHGYRL